MKLLYYVVLALILWRFPAFALEVYGGSTGSLLSYFMFVLLLVVYFFNDKHKISFSFLLLGASYFLISGLIFLPDFNDFINKFLKYLIFIICGSEIIRNVNKNHIFYFLLIGGVSILINAMFFQDDYGRYSGFYLNPNSAGFLALIGFSFCFTLTDKKLKTIGLLVFTVAGFLTLSRYFLTMWLLLNIISIYVNKKNATFFGLGFLAILVLVGAASFLKLNTFRFAVVENILENKQFGMGVEFLENNSRLDNWSGFYDMIFNSPLAGNGYLSLSGLVGGAEVGVHNSYLMIVGESGIIPFSILLFIYFRLLYQSSLKIKTKPYLVMLTLTIIGFLFVSHNFFDNYELLFFSLWIVISLENPSQLEINPQTEETINLA